MKSGGDSVFKQFLSGSLESHPKFYRSRAASSYLGYNPCSITSLLILGKLFNTSYLQCPHKWACIRIAFPRQGHFEGAFQLRQGFSICVTDIWGQVVPYCGGICCALQGIWQDLWPLSLDANQHHSLQLLESKPSPNIVNVGRWGWKGPCKIAPSQEPPLLFR